MDERMVESILARLQRLEDTSVQMRVGTVNARRPLTLELGESGVNMPGVNGVGHVNDGDKVTALTAGGDAFTLGRLGEGFSSGAVLTYGQDLFYGPVVSVDHQLTTQPSAVLLTSANPVLHVGLIDNDPDNFDFQLTNIYVQNWGPTTSIQQGCWVFWVAFA